jgi:hypothetical protein
MASLLNLGTSVRRGWRALALAGGGRPHRRLRGIHMNLGLPGRECCWREAGGRTGIAPDTAEGIFNGLPVLAVAPASPPNWPCGGYSAGGRHGCENRDGEQRPTLARQ